jgi:site-specific DNA recombinase
MNLSSIAIYARVSSEQQAQANTIASQVAALRERVAADAFTLNEALCFVDDGFTGSTLLRPGLERLRDSAAAGMFDRLYVHSPDRLARNYAYQVLLLDELRRCGVEVVFLNRAIGESAEDQLLLQVQGVVAEYERAKIQERFRRGKRHSAQSGRVSAFSTAPYGYRYIPKSPDAPARFEIVQEEASVVELIYSWVAHERCSIREACRRLQKHGIPTRSGRKAWEAATVRGILRNPAYYGQAAYGKTRADERRPRLRVQRGRPEIPRKMRVSSPRPKEEWIAVAVPAILSRELFDAVDEQLQENLRRHRERQRGANHLLQGLVVCGCCGYACYGQWAQQRPGLTRYGYYRCVGADGRRGDGQSLCRNPSLRSDALEAAVWSDVQSLLDNPQRIHSEYMRRLEELGHPSRQKSDRLHQRKQRLDRSITRLIDAYAEGLLDKSEFEPRLRQTRQSLHEIETECNLLLQREAREHELNGVISCLEQFANQVRDRLTAADWQLRRELIRALVKRVEVGVDAARIVYRVDIYPFDKAPQGGDLRHWVWRAIAALQTPRCHRLRERLLQRPAAGIRERAKNLSFSEGNTHACVRPKCASALVRSVWICVRLRAGRLCGRP